MTDSERKPVPNKVRFEVFKRDNFTCQYCGAKAPDVILNVDHIKPVKTGGDNDISNLITSCFPCNSGKGARELDDNAVIEKQRAQLEELNERRLQLEMLLEWREGLRELKSAELDAVSDYWSKHTGYSLTDFGKNKLKKWLKKFGQKEVLEGMDICIEQYCSYEEDEITKDSIDKAFDYIPRVLGVRRVEKDKPWIRDLYYVRGILRNRLSYVNEAMCMKLLEDACNAGATIESIREFAKTVPNWTKFREGVEEFLEDHGGDE